MWSIADKIHVIFVAPLQLTLNVDRVDRSWPTSLERVLKLLVGHVLDGKEGNWILCLNGPEPRQK